jgi:catechol 2,3-dioxygenase-like lactoylglutathione lyase family enzyme
MSRIFGGTRQLAMVVRDADAAMRSWAERLGVGPFVCLRKIRFDNYHYRGRISPAPIVTLCFAQSGDLQIEIIQQHNDAPSAYTEFLSSGREGCQHIAAWYADRAGYDRAHAAALAQGFTLVHQGEGGDQHARFAYFETGLPGDLMFEIAEALIPGVCELTAMVKTLAADWDGCDPVRDLGG